MLWVGYTLIFFESYVSKREKKEEDVGELERYLKQLGFYIEDIPIAPSRSQVEPVNHVSSNKERRLRCISCNGIIASDHSGPRCSPCDEKLRRDQNLFGQKLPPLRRETKEQTCDLNSEVLDYVNEFLYKNGLPITLDRLYIKRGYIFDSNYQQWQVMIEVKGRSLQVAGYSCPEEIGQIIRSLEKDKVYLAKAIFNNLQLRLKGANY